MAITDREAIKNWFVRSAMPTRLQFWAWLDSFWHKHDQIPVESIEGLIQMLAEINQAINNSAKFKGYFTNVTSLNTAHPSPEAGATAWVGTPYPGKVYKCEVAGIWIATTDTPQAPIINLDEYAKLVDVAKKADKSVVYNLTQTTGVTYTDKQTARNAVPANLRGLDQIVVYRLASGTITEQFNGANISGWAIESNWGEITPPNVVLYKKYTEIDLTEQVKKTELNGIQIITPVSVGDVVGRYNAVPSTFRIVDKYELKPNTRYIIELTGTINPTTSLLFLYDNKSDIGASSTHPVDTVNKRWDFTTGSKKQFMSFQLLTGGAGITITSYRVLRPAAAIITPVPFSVTTGKYITRPNSLPTPVGTYDNAASGYRLISKMLLKPNTEYTISYEGAPREDGDYVFLYPNSSATSAAKYHEIVNNKLTFTTDSTNLHMSMQTAIAGYFNYESTLKISYLEVGYEYSLVLNNEEFPLSDLGGNETIIIDNNDDCCLDRMPAIDGSTPLSEADAKFYEPWVDDNILKVKMPKNVKEKVILDDEPFELNPVHSHNVSYCLEASMIEIDGEHRIYYTGWAANTKNYICFSTIDLKTMKLTEHKDPIIGLGFGGAPSDREANCSQVFKHGGYIYCVASNGYGFHESGVYLYRSTDGINFVDLGALHNSSIPLSVFGNHWIIPEEINGEYYWFYENRQPSSVWKINVAKSTNITGPYTNIGQVNEIGENNGMYGGSCVIYHDGKFRMFYHYGIGGDLPTVLGYAEAPLSTPTVFTKIHNPMLGLDRKPLGETTDQVADPAVYEFNNNVYMVAEYARNYPIPGTKIFLWKSKGMTLNKLFKSV